MKGWTLERRLQQSLKIQQCRPWDDSTGPRTSEGKAALHAMLTRVECVLCSTACLSYYVSRAML